MVEEDKEETNVQETGGHSSRTTSDYIGLF